MIQSQFHALLPQDIYFLVIGDGHFTHVFMVLASTIFPAHPFTLIADDFT